MYKRGMTGSENQEKLDGPYVCMYIEKLVPMYVCKTIDTKTYVCMY